MKDAKARGQTTRKISRRSLDGPLTLFEPNTCAEDESSNGIPGAVALPGIGLPSSGTSNEIDTISDQSEEERIDDGLSMMATDQVGDRSGGWRRRNGDLPQSEILVLTAASLCVHMHTHCHFLGGLSALIVYLAQPENVSSNMLAGTDPGQLSIPLIFHATNMTAGKCWLGKQGRKVQHIANVDHKGLTVR